MPLAQLYSKLIAPVRGRLTGTGLLIVPYGVLATIPFAALRDEDSFLIEDFALAQIPTVSALEIWRRQPLADPSEMQVEVLGPPANLERPLRGAEHEARRVAQLLGVVAKEGCQATEADLYSRSPYLDVLHIASHGEYPPESPLFGRIQLQSSGEHDGFLEVHEIWDRLDLRRSRLVTLSGCETGLGETTLGDDALGMSTAFLAAGSRSVISTLWRVPDNPSADLMVAFYQYWRADRPVARALQEAQLEILRSKDGNQPYLEWAGYFVSGDPMTMWP